MTPSHPCGSPAAKKLGCTCEPPTTNNGKQSVFIPLTCPVHSQFYQPKEVTE